MENTADFDFDGYYQEKVNAIDQLKIQLAGDPGNTNLKQQIRAEEDELYGTVIQSSRELESYLKLNWNSEDYGEEN